MPKDVTKYDQERRCILQKLYDILELTPENNKFSLKELDNNIEKQNAIIALEGDVKKYFTITGWGYFSNKNRESKRKYLSFIKCIIKAMNVQMITSPVVINKECDTLYYFLNI
jgi:hypothetical protein